MLPWMADLPTEPRGGISLTPGGGFLLEAAGSATIFIPEMLSEEHRLMKETADGFMRREVEPGIAEIESKKPGLMPALLRKPGALGLLGHAVPVPQGCLGADLPHSGLIIEALRRQ